VVRILQERGKDRSGGGMLIDSLDQYSVSFEYKKGLDEHFEELEKLRGALLHGPVTVLGEVVEDIASEKTCLRITSWQLLCRWSRSSRRVNSFFI
jgi:hypothetical protein